MRIMWGGPTGESYTPSVHKTLHSLFGERSAAWRLTIADHADYVELMWYLLDGWQSFYRIYPENASDRVEMEVLLAPYRRDEDELHD